MQRSLGRQHTLTIDYDLPLSILNADPRLLRFVISNLVSNAIKYSPIESVIRFELTEQRDQLTFRVGDQGIGITEDDIDRLFEPYFRGANVDNVGGTGLGLKIVKDCVEIHGGTIRVDSVLGEGSTFTVILPLSDHASNRAEEPISIVPFRKQ